MCHNIVQSLLCWFLFMEKQIEPEEIIAYHLSSGHLRRNLVLKS